MNIASAWSTHYNSQMAVDETYEMLVEELQAPPHLMLVHSSSNYDNKTILKRLRSLAPSASIQGGTSCMAVITERGFHTKANFGLGILGVLDPEGAYGVGIGEYGDDPAKGAASALVQALEEAGRPGELPVAIVMTNCPGQEEKAIRAIENYLGTSVPILGGTSADNDMSGQWQQFGNDSVQREGISIAVLFPSGDVGYAFHSGYEPTKHSGRATRASGRVLYEIDGRFAAEVYNEWTDGLIADILPGGGSLVPTATFTPMGHPVGKVGGIPYFQLSYPVAVLPDCSLQLFAEVHQGSEIVLMRGTPDNLATRAERVAEAAIDAAPFQKDEVYGGLLFFCAGCMLAVQDRMDETAEGLKRALQNKPFLCSFTLGEQGCFIGGENRHGNLMITCLLFGPIKAE